MKHKKIIFTIGQNGSSHQSRLLIPGGDIPLMNLIPSMYYLFDRILTVELKKFNVACKKGCSQCCRQLVPVSIPELFYLEKYVKTLPENKQALINEKLEMALAQTETSGVFPRNGPLNYRNVDQAYFDLNLSCPFLEEGGCVIYKHRPFACREYYVSSDSQYCGNPYRNEIDKVKIKRNIGGLIAAFASRLYSLPPRPIPLILFQIWADQNRALGNIKWPGIWLFEKIADCLAGLNDEELSISYQIMDN
jgi:Fe-S-cluster containining protein